ncbi:MAG: hypothetical protein ACHQFZ_09290 [Acidimicrobiales bacterium]
MLTACSSGGSGSHHLSANEHRYGASPQQGSNVTYQPDVVFVGGADSVKSVSSNGLVWTISGSAPNVNELQPGKILFASSLGVGRILAVSSQGGDKQVVLGPVSITDVIRDGSFSSAAPIPLGSVEAYAVPNQPGLLANTASVSRLTPGPLREKGGGAPRGLTLASAAASSPANAAQPSRSGSNTISLPPVRLVAYLPEQQRPMGATGGVLTAVPDTLPAPSPSPPPSSVSNYQLDPFCCREGLGVSVVYNNNGLLVKAKVSLHFDKPTVSYKLAVAGGKVTAAVELHGAAGIHVGFEATSTSGLQGNVANQRVQIPVEFSFPVQAGPVPLTFDFDQVFGMDTAFTAKNSLFVASGDYTFNGTLGFGIVNNVPTVYNPQNFTPTKSITSDVTLESVGPASMIIAYAAKFSVGIGLLLFRTGPWYELTFAAGVTDTGPTSQFQCRKVSLAITSRYGIGYRVPKPVADVVNKFLGALGIRPFQSSGGLVSPSITALKKSSTFPPIAACA